MKICLGQLLFIIVVGLWEGIANGCYRDIEELVLKLADFYLNSDQYSPNF
jgi:hypothetical protein